MHKQTKAVAISPEVKSAVHARDGKCVLCGSIFGIPNAHYIPRSRGGLGIEQNIVELCPTCHYRYDNTPDRPVIKEILRRYLQSKYQNWSEEKLIYRKWDIC